MSDVLLESCANLTQLPGALLLHSLSPVTVPKPQCLELLKVDISAGALRMTALIYCHFQCSRGNVRWDFSAGTLKLTVNQCCHSHSSRGEVRPICINKGMKAQCTSEDSGG